MKTNQTGRPVIAMKTSAGFALEGEAWRRAVAAARKQIAAWGLKMPALHPPLAYHFGLNDFYKTGEIEFWVANTIEDGYCGKFLFVFDGQTCPYHHHARKHETFFIVKGRVRMRIDGRNRTLKAGDVFAVQPGVDHAFTGLGPALLMEVSKPCRNRDSIFADRRIGRL